MSLYPALRQALRAVGALAWACCAVTAHAGVVAWSSPTAISGDSDVSTNGTLVMAYNLGSQQAATVNGVTFQSFFVDPAPAFPADHVQTVGNATLALRNREREQNVLENRDSFTTQGPFAGLSSDYQTLLRSSAFNNFADRFDNPAVLTLAGLVLGQVYQFQAWFNDSALSGCCAFGLGLWDMDDRTGGVDLSPNLLRDANSGDVVEGGLGQFVLATFTADSTTKSFGFMRSEINGGLNGFQLRQQDVAAMPEPATLALAAAALLAGGFAGRARRRG